MFCILYLSLYFICMCMFRVFNMFARKIESDDPSKERLLKLKRKLGELVHDAIDGDGDVEDGEDEDDDGDKCKYK